MKHSISTEKIFEPVVVTITLETREEVEHLREVIGQDDESLTTPLWDSLNNFLTKK